MAVRHGNVKRLTHLTQCDAIEGSVTMGYITFLPRVEGLGAAFLNVFGINGTATRLFCDYVQTNLSTWVTSAIEGDKARLLACKLRLKLATNSLPDEIKDMFELEAETVIDVSLSMPTGKAKQSEGRDSRESGAKK